MRNQSFLLITLSLVFMLLVTVYQAFANPLAGGAWEVQQKNVQGAVFRGTFNITQSGNQLSGTAEWQNHTNGKISGILRGEQIEMNISYLDGLIGTYKAQLSSDCRQLVNGTSTSNRGSDSAIWTADRKPSVAGNWNITQLNQDGAKFHGQWVLTQRGDAVSGTANWSNHMRGAIKGTVKGSELDVKITYASGLEGAYKGTVSIGCAQAMSGISISKRNNDKATWTGALQ